MPPLMLPWQRCSKQANCQTISQGGQTDMETTRLNTTTAELNKE